jgi:pentatricopeptide repeat protein
MPVAARQLDAWGFGAIIRGHAQSGDMGSALRVHAEMRAKGIAPNAVRVGGQTDRQTQGISSTEVPRHVRTCS